MTPEQEALSYARTLTNATPEEIALLAQLAEQAGLADAGVNREAAALGQRGDDLANVDEAYMERAYRPMFERLMESHRDIDAGILEDMNRRGIMSQGSSADNFSGTAGSEPEAYQRMLLARDTKAQAGRSLLEAQNQAVQQKLAQYQARTAETNQANVRYDQTMTPLLNARVMPETERAGLRTNAWLGKLGHGAAMHNINTGRQIASQDRIMSGIGGAMGALGTVGAAFMLSDQNAKTDIEEAQSPDEALNDIDNLQVQKWKYKMGDGTEHEGAMAQDMPGDMVSDDNSGVDVVSYLGKLTGAVQGLNEKLNKYEQLLAQGV